MACLNVQKRVWGGGGWLEQEREKKKHGSDQWSRFVKCNEFYAILTQGFSPMPAIIKANVKRRKSKTATLQIQK